MTKYWVLEKTNCLSSLNSLMPVSTTLVHHFDKYYIRWKYVHTQSHTRTRTQQMCVYLKAISSHHFFMICSLLLTIFTGTFLCCPFPWTVNVCGLTNLKELHAFPSALKKTLLHTLILRSLIFFHT